MTVFERGDLVVVTWHLGRIVRPARSRSHGFVVETLWPPRGPGDGSLPYEVQEYLIRPAVVGQTICPEPYSTHFCGLIHVSQQYLDELTKKGLCAS